MSSLVKIGKELKDLPDITSLGVSLVESKQKIRVLPLAREQESSLLIRIVYTCH